MACALCGLGVGCWVGVRSSGFGVCVLQFGVQGLRFAVWELGVGLGFAFCGLGAGYGVGV